MHTTIIPLPPEDRAGFKALVSIYKDAIEPSEQIPAEVLAGFLTDRRHSIIVARAGTAVIGFAMSFFPVASRFWLLNYMAVANGVRSQGIGSKLFKEAISRAQSRVGSHPCLIEIDTPTHIDSAGSQQDRLRFYARLGCRRISGLDYILPPVGVCTPPPMQMLLHGLQGQSGVAKSEVRSWLSALYSQLYSCRADDGRIELMQSQMADFIELETLQNWAN